MKKTILVIGLLALVVTLSGCTTTGINPPFQNPIDALTANQCGADIDCLNKALEEDCKKTAFV